MTKDEHNSDSDELRGEYSRDDLQGGQRSKHLEAYRKGTNLALLAPDVRAAFPTDESVNQALRSVIDNQKRSA